MNRLTKYLALVARKPAVLPRALVSLWQARVLRHPVLRGAELAVTYQCQAQCPKCSVITLREPERPEMTRAQIFSVARQIAARGAILIDITGGEPLLRKDIADIVADLGKLPVIVSLATNGLLLTDELLSRLRDGGLQVLQVGISSPVAEEHDRETGVPGSFATVMSRITAARRRGIEVLLNTVITREVLHSDRMAKMVSLAKERRCFLSVILPAPVGGWQGKDVMLAPEDYQSLKPWLRYPFVTTDTETCYERRGCPAGGEKIYISAYGDVYPCPFIQRRCGNALSEDIASLWERMRKHAYTDCVNIKKA